MTGFNRLNEFQGMRVAFVSTRIAGSDGVSLETEKWADVLERLGVECYYIAGECDRSPERTAIIEQAHFRHPAILSITERAFECGGRDPRLTDAVMLQTQTIRRQLNQALENFGVQAIVAENALTIPMNIPLGIAIVQALKELGLGCIAHHHDFYWERERFRINAVDDFIRYAFPPALPQIQHVVINSVAGEEFSRRTGISCRVVPNVMDFANPPPPVDDYSRSFRAQIGMGPDDLLILQPTRVVARKGIEHSVELVRRLGRRGARLVISHAAGDEGETYVNFLRLFSDLMRVKVVLADRWVSERRETTPEGRRQYTLQDIYHQADLVAYPSEYEGFGNAFLETVYFRRPILCKRYPIFRTDIKPYGFRTVDFDDYITRPTVEEAERLLSDRRYQQEMVEQNYRVARQYFSYEVLEDELRPILRRAFMPNRCK